MIATRCLGGVQQARGGKMIRIKALPLNNTPEAMGTVRQNGYMCSNGYGAVRHGEARGSWRVNKGAVCQTCTQRGDP